MKMPGFNAEASLYKSTGGYMAYRVHATGNGLVTPSVYWFRRFCTGVCLARAGFLIVVPAPDPGDVATCSMCFGLCTRGGPPAA